MAIRTWLVWERCTPRQRLAAGALLLGVVAAAWLAWRIQPTSLSQSPLCPSRRWLGVYCPGCGSSRACHALAHGEVSRAWRFNPALILAGVPALAWLVVACGAACIAGSAPRLRPPARWAARATWALLGLLVAWGVVRNLPGEAFDVFRPPATPTTLPTSMERIPALERLLAADPADPFCLYAMAQEYLKGGREEEALRWFDRTLAADPDHAYAAYHKACTLRSLGRAEEALAAARAGAAAARRSGDGKAASELAALIDEWT